MDRAFHKGPVGTSPPDFPLDPVNGFPVQSDMAAMRLHPGAWWFHMIGEELCNVAKLQGGALDKANMEQVHAGILRELQAFTKSSHKWRGQRSRIVNVPFASSMSVSFKAGNCFHVGPIYSNCVLLSPVDKVPGQSGLIAVQQDGVGGRALAFGGDYQFTDDLVPSLTAKPNAVDYFVYLVLRSGRVRLFPITSKAAAETTWHPAAGTELSRYCSGTTLMGLYADGKGGTTEAVVEQLSAQCGYVPPTPLGTLLSTFCRSGTYTQVGVYADGNYGTYEQDINTKSPACGWNPPAAGTPTGFTECRGPDLYAQFNDGAYGSYWSLSESNSPTCNP